MIRMNSSAAWPNGVIGNWEKLFSFNAAGGDRSPGVWRYPSERYIHWRFIIRVQNWRFNYFFLLIFLSPSFRKLSS